MLWAERHSGELLRSLGFGIERTPAGLVVKPEEEQESRLEEWEGGKGMSIGV